MYTWLLRVLVALVLSVGGTLSCAQAEPVDDALTLFTKDKYPDTAKGIEALAASGHKTAAQILEALGDRRLFYSSDHKLYFKDKAGNLLDAKSGEKAKGVDAASLKTVRINNALRRNVEAAVDAASLTSPDPKKRKDAAEALFRARKPDDLKKIETALEREKDPVVRRTFEEARAAIYAGMPSATEDQKRKSVELLKARDDRDSIRPLEQIAASSSGQLKTEAEMGATAIKIHLQLWYLGQNAWYGITLGSVLLLAAIGLAITFGVMGVINMAHGEMVMIGAYTTFVVQEAIREYQPSLFEYSLAIAIPLAFIASGIAGILIERFVIRFLYGRPLETLLATWGVSLILQQAVRSIFGANNRKVGNPDWMSGSFHWGGLEITYNYLWITVFTIAVFIALQIVLRATPFGLRVRAVTQNRRMAASMGINTGRLDALAFGLGSGIAGIAGVALSQISNVSPDLGQSYIINSFLVVVFGGVGSLWGTLVAATTLGVANKFLEILYIPKITVFLGIATISFGGFVVGAVLAKILLLVFVILFIQKKPRGLFALKGRAVEA